MSRRSALDLEGPRLLELKLHEHSGLTPHARKCWRATRQETKETSDRDPRHFPSRPRRDSRLLEAFRRSKTMFAAVSLGIFDSLEEGPKSLATLAETLDLNPDALERLLDACIGLHLLDRRGDDYENTPVASTYLCKRSPSRLTGYIGYSNDVMWKLWDNLEDAIREGTHRWKQTFGWDGPIFSHFFRTEDALREFLMGMHGYGVISSPHVVTAFDLGQFERLVNLGGATGHLAIAACRAIRTCVASSSTCPGPQPWPARSSENRRSRIASR